MRMLMRLSLCVGAAVYAQMALASISYNVLQATISYQNGDSNTLDSVVNGNTITFTSPSTMKVGGDAWTNDGHAAADITIIYTVESDVAIHGIDLSFSGEVQNFASLGYSELVESWSPGGGAGSVFASTSGLFKGDGLPGGSDGAFTQTTTLNFDPVFSYKVKKTFSLHDLDLNPELSFARLDSVEQTAVPEPASMTALALGGLGLLARRRRK